MSVRNVSDAEGWFIENHTGTLHLVGADGCTANVSSCDDARAFFREHGEVADAENDD